MNFKAFVADMVRAETDRANLKKELTASLGSEKAANERIRWLNQMRRDVIKNALFTKSLRLSPEDATTLFKLYDTCTADYENEGHPFGTGLTADQKKDLTAFLATL